MGTGAPSFRQPRNSLSPTAPWRDRCHPMILGAEVPRGEGIFPRPPSEFWGRFGTRIQEHNPAPPPR